MNVSDFAVPSVVAFIALVSLVQRIDIFAEFIEGAKEGLETVKDIFPSLLALVLAVGMFRASGGLELLCSIISPVTDALSFPPECTPLLIMRPFSGSGSIAILDNILKTHGPDSFIGRLASIMSGSTETTFYTLAVYFGAVKIKDSKYAVPCAVMADVASVVMSLITLKYFFS